MKYRHLIKTAVSGLRAHKSRSALTILGIIIGIMSIILIMAIGEGAENLIVSQVQGMGSKTIVVIPGREPKGPTDPSIVDTILSDSLKERDMEALKNKGNVPTLEKIMPVVFGAASAAYEGETYRMTVIGSSELLPDIFDLELDEGNFFSDQDVRGQADVVVIGSKVKEELFGSSPALYQRIKIKGKSFRVIGVLPEKGQVSLFNFDETTLIPYTTAQYYIFGIKHFNRLVIEANSEKNIDLTVSDIKATLRERHGITDPDKDDFFIATQADVLDTLNAITSTLTLLLISVASISLLVGGIGIMNIMLVNVTERTREIGLRKALGATKEDILSQFLLEAVILTMVGGLFGIGLGALFSKLTAYAFQQFVGVDWKFIFPITAAVIGLTVAATIGVIFGLYPASQASKKSPIEALRYE